MITDIHLSTRSVRLSLRSFLARLLFAVLCVSGAVYGITQDKHYYKSNDGNLSLGFASFQSKQLSDGVWRYVVTGGVTAISVKEGLTMSSQNAVAVAGQAGSATEFRMIDGDGDVRMVKKVTTPKGERTTLITGSKAHYVAGKTESTVHVENPVHIVDIDSAKRQTLSIHGTDGIATLIAGKAAKGSALRAANLKGPIVLDIDQAPSKGATKPGNLHATGDTLDMETENGLPVITMHGHVYLKGTGAAWNGETSSLNRVVLHVDAKGQVSAMEAD